MQSTSGDSTEVDSLLSRLEGNTVLVHISTDSVGCLWGKSQMCPMGHSTVTTPSSSLFEKTGPLSRGAGGTWRVGEFQVPLPLFEGHVIRLEAYPSSGDLQGRIFSIRDKLQKIRGL